MHVNIGQRYSVVINASRPAGGEYSIRATLERECFLPFATYNNTGLASIGYKARGTLKYSSPTTTAAAAADDNDEQQPAIRSTGSTTATTSSPPSYTNPNPQRCFDIPFQTPRPQRPEAAYPLAAGDPQYIVDFQFRQVGEVNRIFLNRTSWAAYTADATLWQALEQTFAAAPGEDDAGGAYHNWGFRLDQQVLLVPQGSESVQVALNSLDVMEHPFHMHGMLNIGPLPQPPHLFYLICLSSLFLFAHVPIKCEIPDKERINRTHGADCRLGPGQVCAWFVGDNVEPGEPNEARYVHGAGAVPCRVPVQGRQPGNVDLTLSRCVASRG